MHVLTTKNSGAKGYWRFQWLRYKGKYSISYAPPILMAALLARTPHLKFPFIKSPDEPNPEIYSPLEEAPGISREFAAIRDPVTALDFANRYGILGLDSVPRYIGYRDEFDRNGENINDWLHEATELRQVYEVLDITTKKAPDAGLSRIVAFARQPESVQPARDIPIIWPETGRGRMKRPLASGLKTQEKLAMARDFIAETYNRKMLQMASPMLLLDTKGLFRNYNRPSSLLGALWLEFGEVASGARKQALCESCEQWMDVTGNRRDKRKHDRCVHREKMARYRAKQKK